MTATVRETQDDHETLLKSYRYLRSAMVGLVLALLVSVSWQSLQQGSFLPSISAYYFTPAQTIFVGVLIAIGACMIALKGIQPWEDVLLNIAGMLAPVVAIVPTSRGEDAKEALKACRRPDGLSDEELKQLDCQKLEELREATEASVQNNMLALFVVGLIALLAALLFAHRDNNLTSRFWKGFLLAGLIYVGGLLVFVLGRDFFIERAHFPAAVGMFACIVGVALSNAMRRRGEDLTTTQGAGNKLKTLLRALFSRGPYSRIALLMVVVVLVGLPLAWQKVFEGTVFWIEAALIVLFGFFWAIQTAERWGKEREIVNRAA